jgi:hypothetical protein
MTPCSDPAQMTVIQGKIGEFIKWFMNKPDYFAKADEYTEMTVDYLKKCKKVK